MFSYGVCSFDDDSLDDLTMVVAFASDIQNLNFKIK